MEDSTTHQDASKFGAWSVNKDLLDGDGQEEGASDDDQSFVEDDQVEAVGREEYIGNKVRAHSYSS